MDRRYPPVEERRVVAAAGAGTARPRVDPGRFRRRIDVGAERRGAGKAANFDASARATDHVEIDHRQGIREWNGRVIRVLRRPEESPFFARERDENERTRKP